MPPLAEQVVVDLAEPRDAVARTLDHLAAPRSPAEAPPRRTAPERGPARSGASDLPRCSSRLSAPALEPVRAAPPRCRAGSSARRSPSRSSSWTITRPASLSPGARRGARARREAAASGEPVACSPSGSSSRRRARSPARCRCIAAAVSVVEQPELRRARRCRGPPTSREGRRVVGREGGHRTAGTAFEVEDLSALERRRTARRRCDGAPRAPSPRAARRRRCRGPRRRCRRDGAAPRWRRPRAAPRRASRRRRPPLGRHPSGTQNSRCRPMTWSMRTTPATRMWKRAPRGTGVGVARASRRGAAGGSPTPGRLGQKWSGGARPTSAHAYCSGWRHTS